MSKKSSKKSHDLVKLDFKKSFTKEELLELVKYYDEKFDVLLTDSKKIHEDDLLYMIECYMPLEKYLSIQIPKNRLDLEEVYFLMNYKILSVLIKNKKIIENDTEWTYNFGKSAKGLIKRLTETVEIEKKLKALCYEFLELFDDDYKKEVEAEEDEDEEYDEWIID